jgi:hypothetical protein
VHACDIQNSNFNFEGPGFEFAAKGSGNWTYLNFNDDCDEAESTYHTSDFKPTPIPVSPEKPIHVQTVATGYFLRSSVATKGRNVTEIPNN